MSTGPAPEAGEVMAAVSCPVCARRVPRGGFCGFCGAHLSPQRGSWAGWWRFGAYAAAPGEHVLRLSLVSSLFPHLPHRSRAAFRAGAAAVVIVLVVFAMLHWQAPLVAVSALGFALLFQLYLQESDVYDDLPVPTLALTAAVGAGLGVGWSLLTGPVAARSYAAAMGAGPGVSWARVLREGLAIPLGAAVLMLVPALLVRMFRPPTRETLDGFLIGSLGAIGFTAASTLTRLAPQLATGPVAPGRTVGGLLVEAGIQGVAMPVTAAAAGGMVGAALWFRRRTDIPHRLGRHLRPTPLVVIGVVLAVYAGLGLIDVAPVTPTAQLGLHLVVAAAALLALRVVLHSALLREEQGLTPGGPLLCAHCAHVVPEMAFCPNCGAATRASSRSSRATRRPAPIDTAPDSP